MITRTRIALVVAAPGSHGTGCRNRRQRRRDHAACVGLVRGDARRHGQDGHLQPGHPGLLHVDGNNKFATIGWHITATSTTFKGNTTLRTLPTTASTITSFPDSVGCTQANCTDTTNSLTYPITIPAATVAPAPVTAFNATAPSGAGGNTVTMQVSVGIPANTFADVYASTLTLAIIEGP